MFRDAQGLTPFMLAVTVRAYPAAVILLDTIHRVVSKVVIPPAAPDTEDVSTTEQEYAIKNVMSAWRSSAAGTGSNPNSNKVASEISTQPVPLFHNASMINLEIGHPWTSSLQPQQSSDFPKG